jgi:hypothetical protein
LFVNGAVSTGRAIDYYITVAAMARYTTFFVQIQCQGDCLLACCKIEARQLFLGKTVRQKKVLSPGELNAVECGNKRYAKNVLSFAVYFFKLFNFLQTPPLSFFHV